MEKQGEDFNPCQTCDCWDGDLGGCTMPPDDTFFACPLYAERYNPMTREGDADMGGL